jgi:hypothetical protein
LAAAGGLVAGPAWALGDASALDIAEIQLQRGTLSRPLAWERLLAELVQTTSVVATPRVVQVEPDDPTLFAHPIAVLVGDGALPPLTDRAAEQLTRFLSYGGFLFIDDTSGLPDSPFDGSVRRVVQRIFPNRPLTVLSSEHSVFRAFFLLDEPVGRVSVHRTIEGVAQGTMNPLLYGRDDLSGALDRAADGSEMHACSPGGERQRREAVKLGINLLMYALTSNYKQDQAHVRQLMLEGRLE